MEDSRRSFKVIWKIKNFTFSLNSKKGVWTPVFLARPIFETRWRLAIFVGEEDKLACILTRDREDFGPERFELDYKLSFMARKTVIKSEMVSNRVCRKGGTNCSAGFLSKTETLTERSRFFLYEDTLTVCCTMWKSQGSISESIVCFPETQIEFGSWSVVLIYYNFSRLATCNYRLLKQPAREEGFHITLRIGDDGNLSFEISHIEYNPIVIFKFEFFIRDIYENRVKCNRRLYYETSSFRIPVTFSKDFLTENGDIFLPNDILTVDCKITQTLLSERFKIRETGVVEYFYKF